MEALGRKALPCAKVGRAAARQRRRTAIAAAPAQVRALEYPCCLVLVIFKASGRTANCGDVAWVCRATACLQELSCLSLSCMFA